MTASYRLSVLLPAYNEEANIEQALTSATNVAERLCSAHEIIVIDDGSVDRTAELVRAASTLDSRIRLVQHDHNRGYGEALRTGFRAARLDLVFFTDADNQFDLDDLERFLPWIDKVAVVAGYRLRRQDPMLRRFVAWAWNRLVRLFFYVPVRDIDCAFKLFRRYVFESLDLESVGAMVNTELMVKLGRSGAGVVEVGVTHRPRTAGTPRGAHPKVILLAIVELAKMYRRLQQTDVDQSDLAVRTTSVPSLSAPDARRVVVIGGGIAGCAAALRLGRAGHKVTLVERSASIGGLVVSFSVGGTPLECFYHHIFPHEHDIITLIHSLGLGSKLGWFESSTGILHESKIWPFTSPADLLRFGPLTFPQRVHTGFGALRMSRVRDWQPLDTLPADAWLRGYCGNAAADIVWEPLLRAKFGSGAKTVPAAWMWGRLTQRGGARDNGREHLGYLRGGFRQLFEALDGELRQCGVDVQTGTEVKSIDVDGERVIGVTTSEGFVDADGVVFAGTLNGLPKLLASQYHDPRWLDADSLGVLCVVIELRRSLSDLYWTNVCDPSLPFGGIIEHTNLMPKEDYDGRHIVYLSRYFTHDEPVATTDPRAEAERWVDLLIDHVGGLHRDDILAVHPFRTGYAAPLVKLGQLDRIPPMTGPVAGLYVTTTAQIYPQDRGMDEGVRAGYRTADVILAASGDRVSRP
ncbi:MAG: FAD-dependent oxidoreductase [Actinomycetota bacterium]|nr:FAD-dependent oxidoreductase [Actinomycetota bacterium]